MGRFARLLATAAVTAAVTISGAVAPTTPASAACTISKTFRQGMRGPGVNCIELRLKALGYQSTYIDSYFGSVTTTAVKRFQRANGLTINGVVNQATATALSIWSDPTTPPPPPPSDTRIKEQRTIGYSVEGRPIIAYRLGSDTGTPALAVGVIHGDESRGKMMIDYMLNTAVIPSDVNLWVIRTVNPDGLYRHTRYNAHKVDLNRNFDGGDWVKSAAGTERYSGPSAASEPETVAVQRFLDEIQPRVAIWWHQIGQHVDDNRMVANYPLLQRYSALTGYPIRFTSCVTTCTGNATTYINRKIGGASSFVVEMPSFYTSATAARHAKAFLTIAHES